MTVREFLRVIEGDKCISIYDKNKRILRIDSSYMESVKEELLDREIEKHGVAIWDKNYIDINLEVPHVE